MSNLPNFLSCTRLALIPIFALARLDWSRQSLSLLLHHFAFNRSIGRLVGRRLHLTTELGAKLDSWADFLTYLSLSISGWWLRPEVVREERFWLAGGIACYLAAIMWAF